MVVAISSYFLYPLTSIADSILSSKEMEPKLEFSLLYVNSFTFEVFAPNEKQNTASPKIILFILTS